MHRETHHPTIFNQPSAPISITIEMDMKLEKKNRFLDNFTGTILLPHPFNTGAEKKIIAFCKQPDDAKKAMDAGALIAGGSKLITEVQRGTVLTDDYDYVVAHVDIMQEMIALRGLLKRKFPTVIKENVGREMDILVEKFQKGLDFRSIKDEYNHDFGWVETMIGTLDMPTEAIEANISTLLQKIVTLKKAQAGPLMTSVYLTSPPSEELFMIDHNVYAPFVPPEESDDEEAAKA
jgi:large subunit ribosomal protein L1